MRIKNKFFNEWELSIRKKLRDLSLRSSGDMCKRVKKFNCDTFVAFNGDTIIGWAIFCINTQEAMVYVRKTNRRMGIGRVLLNNVISKYEACSVRAWDTVSGRFFYTMIKESSSNTIVVNGRSYLKS
jgi:L-amino acid N-acyltransferase YncA